MDFEETVKEIIREEVRAMLYKQGIATNKNSKMILVKSETQSKHEKYSFEHINELIEQAVTATGLKTKSELFEKVLPYSRNRSFALLNQFKNNPKLRMGARTIFVEKLTKAIKGESCEYDV